MNKSTLLTILLISAICLLVDAVSGFWIADMGTLASVVLSILFVINVRKQFGPEADNARTSCLVSAIVNTVGILSAHTAGIVLSVITLGLFAWVPGVIHALSFLLNIGFGIWQLVAWSKLKGHAQPAAA